MLARTIPIAVAISFAAAAADKMSHSVLGWSPDGRYLAFERSVTLDGSGYPMCEVLVVDAEAGEISGGPFKAVLEDERISPEHACVAARDQAQQTLDARRIDPGLSGKWLKLAAGGGAKNDSGPRRSTRSVFHEGGRACALRLSETPAPSPVQELRSFAWQLVISCGGEEQIVRCTECGKEPPVASAIRILEARSYRGRIAVFLARSTRGFEGMDVTPIVAASPLPPAGSTGGARAPRGD
jgi:predicted secreted protein DUF2259